MTDWKFLKMKRIRRSERAIPIGGDEVVIQRIQFSAVGSKKFYNSVHLSKAYKK